MIDYTNWKPLPLLLAQSEPCVLTPMQRNVFWHIAAGRKLTTIATDLAISLRTVEAHKTAIQERIPGLDSFAAYGILALQVIQEWHEVPSPNTDSPESAPRLRVPDHPV